MNMATGTGRTKLPDTTQRVQNKRRKKSGNRKLIRRIVVLYVLSLVDPAPTLL